jgi:LysM repeat protein
MIKRLVCLGAVSVLAISCASSDKKMDGQTSSTTGGTSTTTTAAYGDQNSSLPAKPVMSENSGKSYTVVSGDSLWKIAHKNGVSVNALKKANNMTDDMIKPGQVLVIP